MPDIWIDTDANRHVKPLDTVAFRIVESQEKVATMTLVDTVEEQMLLETILEDSKPAACKNNDKHHYLISTPFRYPPLRHGSRFGIRSRPGLFYASLQTRTTLAECAYYRFVFWQGMSEPPAIARLITEHTTFAVTVKCARALYLEQAPFTDYSHEISHPNHYEATQSLGESMRAAKVEAFTYPSARDTDPGLNIGVFTPEAIQCKRPLREQLWSCITTAEQVSFMRLHSTDHPLNFPLEHFLHDHKLPIPAC